MKEKELTAVEWLIDEHFGGIENCTPDFKNKIEQAKEMEKEQIIKAFTKGDIFGADYFDGVNITAENYYNQTFKIEQDGKWK
jgi:hypothetical protein